MYKIIASSSSQNSFEIDTHNGQNKSPTLAFVGLTVDRTLKLTPQRQVKLTP